MDASKSPFAFRDTDKLLKATSVNHGATIFPYYVKNPSDFGVVEFNEDGLVTRIEEKPTNPKSNFAVTGLYFYDNDVIEIAKSILPSKRNELEITDINNAYIDRGKLFVQMLGRGFAWLDTGTPDSLMEAGTFIQTIEHRQGLKVACLEEIAFNNKWIDKEAISSNAKKLSNTTYGKYLKDLIDKD